MHFLVDLTPSSNWEAGMSLKARSGSFLSTDASQDDAREKWDDEWEKQDPWVRLLNLFPRVLHDAAIKREWTRAIYARWDYPTDNRQRPDNRRNSGSPASVWRIEFIAIDLLNHYRAAPLSGHTAPQGVRVNETFVIVPSNLRRASLPSFCRPLTIIKYIVSIWKRPMGWNWRKSVEMLFFNNGESE